MTHFLHEEEIYHLADIAQNQLQDKIEGKDTIVLLDRALAELSEDISSPLFKMLEVVGKQDSTQIIEPKLALPFRDIQRRYAPKHVIVFGLSPLELKLNISARRNQIIQFESERIIFCEGVELMTDRAKKKALWQQLQNLFELA